VLGGRGPVGGDSRSPRHVPNGMVPRRGGNGDFEILQDNCRHRYLKSTSPYNVGRVVGSLLVLREPVWRGVRTQFFTMETYVVRYGLSAVVKIVLLRIAVVAVIGPM